MTTTEVITRLAFSLVLGGIIGAEREFRSKSAGLRTLMLISVGAAVFTMLSIELGLPNSPDRIASNIVTGIGFVGAGVIFKSDNNRMNGITTAATIWVTAAMGMAIGAGHELAASVACVCTLAILMLFRIIERYIDKVAKIRRYTITCTNQNDVTDYLEKFFTGNKLKILNSRYVRKDGKVTGYFVVEGYKVRHDEVANELMATKNMEHFEFYENA